MSTEQMNQIASRTYRACEGDNERYWETRKSTGVVLKDGSFLQTYPERRHFYSLAAWKNHWNSLLSDPQFVGEEERQYALRKKNFAAIPAFEPKLAHIRSDLENYWRVIQQRPTAEAQSRATVENFTCPACGLGSGADHRMCICRSYNYSVSAWEIACGLRVPEEPVAAVEPATTTIPGEENFGSSTYRAYKNGQRISTAVVMKDGSICQVWPLPKRNFYSLNAWKKAMREEHGETDIKGEEETIYRHYYAQHEDVIGNTYEVALRQTLEDYGRIIQQRLDEEPPIAAKAEEPIPLASIPAPPPHVPVATQTSPQELDYQTGYLVTAVFGNEKDGMNYQQKTCSNLVAAGEVLRNYYRAYCLMINEPDQHFLDKKLTVEHLRKCLGDSAECNVAFFDSLSLSIREIRIWC